MIFIFEIVIINVTNGGDDAGLITFQDFEYAKSMPGFDLGSWVYSTIEAHRATEEYKTAITADLYDRQKNKTINEYIKQFYSLSGMPVEDFTASNNKLASNFFRRLNKQRCTYSLGNGVSFANDPDGNLKESLGESFDKVIFDAAYKALIHGRAFLFWNVNRLYMFPVTEFVPLPDENNNMLRAGIRFWRIDSTKPMVAVLYEEDGFTVFHTVRRQDNRDGKMRVTLEIENEKRAYKQTILKNAVGDESIAMTENYSALPIVTLWGSELHQSTLVGMQSQIDSFDLIRSGFANDLTDCSEIYWLIENCGGMTEKDLARVRDRLKLNHIGEVSTGDGASIKPYTQEIPYQARKTYLDDIRTGIYEDFGGLDVHQVSADSTNDHLEAAYQPLDENADDFEYQLIECIQQILLIADKDVDTPVFKRNRISNVKEQVEIVLSEADYLDDETVLRKLPNITIDEVAEILKRKDAEDYSRFGGEEV